ncbi:MAG: 2-oxo acid dehydrogenase subunit E2 [Steroidobacteraceae bacterium]|nr:2-oxo acid dehydrogenase subunit E2 [Steroidobacteraceae bacterium]
MANYVFKMPDLGEGTVSAEILAWHVKPGDTVAEDQIIADVMTEKAAIEVPAPVSGKVVRTRGEPGEMVAVGSELIVFDTGSEAVADGVATVSAASAAKSAPAPATTAALAAVTAAPAAAPARPAVPAPARVMASPATRRRAQEAGIDLRTIAGSGPGGRITRADFESAAAGSATGVVARGQPMPARARRDGTTEVKIIGLRRVIAQRMSEAKRNIPHFAYVEEIDVTELEALRAHLNAGAPDGAPSLTLLPFLGLALARALPAFPQCNARHDAERNVVVQHAALHLGIATQTPDGLKVPVVRHAESLSLRELAAAIRDVADRARRNKSPRDELAGSTLTITSLGRLGGIASTPVINAPEVAIIGVNKVVERPVVRDGAITVRRMMNLSSSFDHRFVDGYDAASMIQALKGLLEHPATIFIQE